MKGLKMNEKKKVAVHRYGWQTKAGFVCRSWGEYWVVVGSNPVGPKGGTCGNFESGNRVGHRFRRRAEAENYARRLAETNGYELLYIK